MHSRQLNNTVTMPNCVFVLAFAFVNYEFTPLFIVMSFLHYYLSNLSNFKEVDSSCFFKQPTVEPPSGATGPLDHPFPSNTINDVPDPRGRITVDLGCKRVGGGRVAIFDRLQ